MWQMWHMAALPEQSAVDMQLHGMAAQLQHGLHTTILPPPVHQLLLGMSGLLVALLLLLLSIGLLQSCIVLVCCARVQLGALLSFPCVAGWHQQLL